MVISYSIDYCILNSESVNVKSQKMSLNNCNLILCFMTFTEPSSQHRDFSLRYKDPSYHHSFKTADIFSKAYEDAHFEATINRLIYIV